MKTLQEIFPKAAKSFYDANPLSPPSTDNKTSSSANVERIKGKRGGHSISMSGEPYWSEGKSGRHGMNKTEAEFAMILEAMKRKGEILRYEFEGITLRWFDMRFTPDFVVLEWSPITDHYKHIQIKFVEVKGAHIHYSQQAMARFKGARGFWPEFTFELHQKTKEGWRQLL